MTLSRSKVCISSYADNAIRVWLRHGSTGGLSLVNSEELSRTMDARNRGVINHLFLRKTRLN